MKNFVFAFSTFLAWAFFSAWMHHQLHDSNLNTKPQSIKNNTQIAIPEPLNKDTLTTKVIKTDSIIEKLTIKPFPINTIFYGIAETKFFETNKIDSLTKVLKSYLSENKNMHLYIEGHTDSIGDVAANYQIGLDRANNFKAYLTSQGIDATRIETFSKGETKPKYENSILEHRKNRRIEITVIENIKN